MTALCLGTGAAPYRVNVRWDDGRLDASCTCPVGSHGRCKHIAALLLLWRDKPQAFLEVEPWDVRLDRLARAELVGIVQQLLQERPELEPLIENLLSASHSGDDVRPAERIAQVDELLARWGDPGEAAGAAALLAPVRESAAALLEQRQPRSAMAAYHAILAGLLARRELLVPTPGELGELLAECVEGLGQCLLELDCAAPLRQNVLKSLLELYHLVVTAGVTVPGFDLADLLRRFATEAERSMVARWIRPLFPAIASPCARRLLGGVVRELEGDATGEEAFADLCRLSARRADLVRRLLQRGRLDEAQREAELADDEELPALVELLMGHQHAAAAERLLRHRASQGGSVPLREWLERQTARQADRERMLALDQEMLRLEPDLPGYFRLRQRARSLGRWDALHGPVLAMLEEMGHLPLLVQIHLDEHDLDRALELLATPQWSGTAMGRAAALEVAELAEASRPDDALAVYRAQAEQLIARHGRESYREACRLLRKVRLLSDRTGRGDEWTAYLAALRHRHRGLRALQEELRFARLADTEEAG